MHRLQRKATTETIRNTVLVGPSMARPPNSDPNPKEALMPGLITPTQPGGKGQRYVTSISDPMQIQWEVTKCVGN